MTFLTAPLLYILYLLLVEHIHFRRSIQFEIAGNFFVNTTFVTQNLAFDLTSLLIILIIFFLAASFSDYIFTRRMSPKTNKDAVKKAALLANIPSYFLIFILSVVGLFFAYHHIRTSGLPYH